MMSWPPVYDEEYMPPPDSRYWFKELETMPQKERDELILKKLKAQLKYCWENSEFYRKKWVKANFHPDDLWNLNDLKKIPIVTKEEFRRDQMENPPYGTNLCISVDDIYTIHGTSGTTGRPAVFAIGYDDVRRIANTHARVMWGFGLRPKDTIMIAAFFSLYLGSWGALWGSQRLKAKSFPFGAGAPGQTRSAVHWAKQLKPTALYGTMSYILHFAEVAYEEGIDPQTDFNFRIIFTSGEPGAALPSMKEKIKKIFNATLIDLGSTAEMSPWMTNGECSYACGMHLWQDVVYTELVDPKTLEPVEYGEEGVPVYTHLERTSQPFIRFFSYDVSTWINDPCECGRTYPRLPKGIYGRIDDVINIRGEKVFPSAIQEALMSVKGYGGEHQIIITRERALDKIILKVEYDKDVEKQASINSLVLKDLEEAFKNAIRVKCGVNAEVILVPPKTLNRTQLKAKRIIDNRELYEELNKLRSHH